MAGETMFVHRDAVLSYIDSTFLMVKNESKVKVLIDWFEWNSVVKFTYALEKESETSFPDIHVEQSEGKLSTCVYFQTQTYIFVKCQIDML